MQLQLVVTNFTYRYGRYEVQAPAWHNKIFIGKDPQSAVKCMGDWFRRNKVLRPGIDAQIRVGKCTGCRNENGYVYVGEVCPEKKN